MRISIDLLPLEFRIEDLKRKKFFRIQAIGLTIIAVVALLAATVVGLRIFQSRVDKKIQNQLAAAESNVRQFQQTQASLFLLKDRLATISKYLETPSKEVQSYNLLTQLAPANVSLGAISINQGGEISVLVSSSDAVSLDRLIEDLINKNTNQGKIKKLSVESLSLNREGLIRLNLKITLQ